MCTIISSTNFINKEEKFDEYHLTYWEKSFLRIIDDKEIYSQTSFYALRITRVTVGYVHSMCTIISSTNFINKEEKFDEYHLTYWEKSFLRIIDDKEIYSQTSFYALRITRVTVGYVHSMCTIISSTKFH